MAKFAPPAVLDAPLDAIAAATELYYCEGQPTSRTDAQTRQAAAPVTMVAGDFVKSNQAGGRRVTVAAKGATASAARPVDHVALCSGTALLYVTTAPVQNSNIGAPINSAAFTIDMPQVA